MTPDEVRDQLNRAAQRIDAQRNLTPQAKRTMLARAFIAARNQLDELKAGEEKRIHREREQLERKLFGVHGFAPDPTAVVARRDANDRASQYQTPKEAAQAMRRAQRDGDHILAKAIAARAADWSGDPTWAAVVDQYVADKPAEAETLQAMRQLPDTDDAVWKLSKAMEYGIAAPSGLGELHPNQLDMLAQQPLDGDQAA
ncbi:hypothetical protein [Streptomyces sp. NPDC015131]|uniref:hypothetical protein n=1 Tax=Streptomyces sp. NPDC015131 TaxID=3364941 RepID=UPI0036F830FE